jgi:hypothetical protein
MEQLNLGMLNNMEATVMKVESTLEHEIRKGQESDEKIKEINAHIVWEKPWISPRMNNAQYGLKRESVYPKLNTYAILF